MFFGIGNVRELVPLLFKGWSTYMQYIAFVVGVLTQLITGFIWVSAPPVYFLWSLILIDFFTGILRAALVKKDFGSKRFPKVIITLFGSTLMLYIAHQSSLHLSILYHFFPPFVFAVMVSTQIISIIENLSQLGVLPKELVEFARSKFGIKALMNWYNRKHDKSER